MGISATVMCNCYQEGRARPCPFPEHVHLDENHHPRLDLDYVGNEYKHELFQEWLETGCEHSGMKRISAFIAGWKQYRAFTEALEEHAPRRSYPALLKALVEGEATPPEHAKAALAELEAFHQESIVVRRAVLVDTERRQDISMGSTIQGGALVRDRITGMDLGFDEKGFFVRDRWELNRELFRAVRVHQRLIHPENNEIEFMDLDTERVFSCRVPFGKIITGEDGLPRMALSLFHVEERAFGPDYFAHITGPLRAVFQASIETGNPVIWH